MEEFKKKIQKKYRLISLFCCLSVIIFFTLKHITANTDSFAEGLVSGAFSGMMVVMIFNSARYFKAMKNEEVLKKMYIEETDERNIAISKETMRTASTISLMVTALAVIVSGFFSPVVSMTLAAALICDTVITVAVNVYYNKKM